MKMIFLIVLLNIPIFSIFGQQTTIQNSRYIDYPAELVTFKDDNVIEMRLAGEMDSVEITITGKYTLENVNGITFIDINWNNNKNEKYLILLSENMCYLYNGDKYPYFRGFATKNPAPGQFAVPYDKSFGNEITATSFLIEGQTQYTTENLNEKIGICWAEGVRGQGINETLFLKMEKTNSIHISTGFVSYLKPYLFKENSRPKKIELSVTNKFLMIIDLEDTSNFQTINLPEQLDKNDILKLKILDVYEGTKYEDTCINTILFDRGKY